MRYELTTLALAPILAPQGIMTRLRTPRLPEPPGCRSGSAGAGPSLRLMVVGDSSAAGVGAQHQDQALLGQLVARLAPAFTVSWRLQAATGWTTAAALADLDDAAPGTFDVAVLALGVNDVTSFVGHRSWCRHQSELRTLLRDRYGVRRIIVSGLPPVHGFPALPQPLRWHLGRRASEFDRSLEAQIAAEADCRYLSLRFTSDAGLMAADGFHPGPGVYAEWGRRAAQLVA